MALNWAKLVEGKKVSNAQLEKEQAQRQWQAQQQAQQLRQAQRQQQAQQQRTSTLKEVDQRRQHNIVAPQNILAKHNIVAEHNTKERGFLGKEWPYCPGDESNSAAVLPVPRTVNQKAMQWIENSALPSWWEEWTTKCHTVGALKQAFVDAFVPWILRREQRGYYEFETYERMLCFGQDHYSSASLLERANERQRRAELPNALRYKSMLDWVQLREKDAKTGGDVPYGNLFWVTCKNITFENCLWAMNVESATFRAVDKNTQEIITGFLKVNGNHRLPETKITWLADFQKYTPLPHLVKEKCAQAKAKAQQIAADDDDDY